MSLTDTRLGTPPPVSGTVGAVVGDTVTCPTYGMASVAAYFSGAVVTPNVAFDTSGDGGVTWQTVQLFSSNTGSLSTPSTNLVFPGVMFEGGVPAAATHFRVRCTTASGAGLTASVATSPAAYRTSQVVNIVPGSAVALNAGGSRIGVVGSQTQAAFADESTTPLAGTGTATGVSRDLTGVASPGSPIATSAGFNEFRALATSDVTGTLHIEASADQVTWWRVSSTPTVAVGAIFYAQVSIKPVTRYMRAVYVNGAGGQAAFLLSTARLD